MKLILASNSPRRREFLKLNGLDFEVTSSPYEENAFTNDPFELTKAFAFGKAQCVFDTLKNKDDYIVLGADTVVFFEGQILGKPKDEENAIYTLKKLSGKTHQVISAFSIITSKQTITDTELSSVIFNDLTEQTISRYVATKLPLDKAGSYGVQDGFNLVKKIIGSYDNVVGLPTEKVIPLLKNLLNR